ncbi:MAG: hypothetical protein V2A73_05840 [Pseudomonadota bacterium]
MATAAGAASGATNEQEGGTPGQERESESLPSATARRPPETVGFGRLGIESRNRDGAGTRTESSAVNSLQSAVNSTRKDDREELSTAGRQPRTGPGDFAGTLTLEQTRSEQTGSIDEAADDSIEALAIQYADEMNGRAALAPVDREIVDERTADEDRPMLEEIRGDRGRDRRDQRRRAREQARERQRRAKHATTTGTAAREAAAGGPGPRTKPSAANSLQSTANSTRIDNREELSTAGRQPRTGPGDSAGTLAGGQSVAGIGQIGSTPFHPNAGAADPDKTTGLSSAGTGAGTSSKAGPRRNGRSRVAAPLEGGAIQPSPVATERPGEAVPFHEEAPWSGLADVAVKLLSSLADPRPIHARQLAAMALKRKLASGDTEIVRRSIQLALLDDVAARVRAGLRPRVRHHGGGLFTLSGNRLERELVVAEQVLAESAVALGEQTKLAIQRRLVRLSLTAFEMLVHIYLERVGARTIERRRRTNEFSYLSALMPAGSLTRQTVVMVVPGQIEIERRRLGDLNVEMRRAKADDGLIVVGAALPSSLPTSNRVASDRGVAILAGDSLATELMRVGIGVMPAALPLGYVDSDFFEELEGA